MSNEISTHPFQERLDTGALEFSRNSHGHVDIEATDFYGGFRSTYLDLEEVGRLRDWLTWVLESTDE